MSAEVVSLRIRCPRLGNIVTIKRADYAIGPMSAKQKYYVVGCRCGSVHKIPTKPTLKPTKRVR